MTEKRTIARPYARSAFEFASAAGTVDAWASALERLAAIATDPVAQALLHHPRVTDAQVVETLVEAGDGAFTGPIENFIRILVEGGRVDIAPQIKELFGEMKAEATGVSNVVVHTAFELEDSQRSSLEDSIKRVLGRGITMSSVVDQTLIGGAIVSVGDKVIDLSVRGRLQGLTNQLS